MGKRKPMSLFGVFQQAATLCERDIYNFQAMNLPAIGHIMT